MCGSELIVDPVATKVGIAGVVEKIHLPVKLIANGHVLGLGDIVRLFSFPLISFCHSFSGLCYLL